MCQQGQTKALAPQSRADWELRIADLLPALIDPQKRLKRSDWHSQMLNGGLNLSKTSSPRLPSLSDIVHYLKLEIGTSLVDMAQKPNE